MLSIRLLPDHRRLVCRVCLPARRLASLQLGGQLYLIAGPRPPYLRWLRLYRHPARRPDELPAA